MDMRGRMLSSYLEYSFLQRATKILSYSYLLESENILGLAIIIEIIRDIFFNMNNKFFIIYYIQIYALISTNASPSTHAFIPKATIIYYENCG